MLIVHEKVTDKSFGLTRITFMELPKKLLLINAPFMPQLTYCPHNGRYSKFECY